jgi:polyisoprenoid-binding protein YceI
MKKASLLVTLSALLMTHAVFSADTYVFDRNHSSIGFLIRHLFTKVPGKFTDFSGKIVFDEDDPKQSMVEVTIKAASVNTSNAARDKDLRSSNFFDVARFPEIIFKSKSVKRTGENTADVTGELTMHGVTKEVVLRAEFNGKGKGPGPEGKAVSGSEVMTTVTGWDAKATLQRSDFGLTWNQMIEGTQVLGDDVEVELHVEG